jgi:hypothetical protein
MQSIPAGSFLIGSPNTEKNRKKKQKGHRKKFKFQLFGWVPMK